MFDYQDVEGDTYCHGCAVVIVNRPMRAIIINTKGVGIKTHASNVIVGGGDQNGIGITITNRVEMIV